MIEIEGTLEKNNRNQFFIFKNSAKSSYNALEGILDKLLKKKIKITIEVKECTQTKSDNN